MDQGKTVVSFNEWNERHTEALERRWKGQTVGRKSVAAEVNLTRGYEVVRAKDTDQSAYHD